MTKMKRITRRTVLRGAWSAIALPWLEAMRPRSASANPAEAEAHPLRMAFLYVPNGVHMPDWTPKANEPRLELPPILDPLQPVKDDLLVLSGLALNPARASGDGGGDHARAMASFLTGRHPLKTDGADLRAGISVDQVAAAKVGHQTRFPSLQLGCEGGKNSGECDHGYSCAYQSNLSWQSEKAPLAKQINPRLVFDRLFGPPAGSGQGEDAARADRRRKSVLDAVTEDARQLSASLGSQDRRKLDEYLTALREIEKRLTANRPAAKIAGLEYARPLGIPADFREHARLLADLLALAFQSNLTRIATFVFGNDGSNRSYRTIGIADGHHDLSHHGGDPAKQARIAKINRHHVEQLAYFLRKLKAIREGDGTLLDHCMIVYGSGISDGNSHAHDNLPILWAGGAGGTVKTGRHLRSANGTPVSNLYVSMLERMGVAIPSFGDSTGRLPGLEG